MADSGATIVELLGDQGNVVDFTVANATGISKGDILELLEPRTAKAPVSSGVVAAGVAAADKEAGDGAVNLGLYQYGIFDMQINGKVNAGEYVSISSGNVIKKATDAEISNGKILGRALETSAAGEVIEVKINL